MTIWPCKGKRQGSTGRVYPPRFDALSERTQQLNTAAGPLLGEPYRESFGQCLASRYGLDAELLLKRSLLLMIGETPAGFNTNKRAKIAPEREVGRFRKVDLDLALALIILEL